VIGLRDEQGISLTEVLVAMTLAVVVFGIAVSAFSAFVNERARTDRRTESQDQARTAVTRVSADLRSAMSAGGAGSEPIQQRSSFDLVFLLPLRTATPAALATNPRGLTHVRLCLDASSGGDGRLWRQTAPYGTGSPTAPATSTCPSSAWPRQEVVASNLVNHRTSPATPLFTWTLDPAGQVTDVAVRPVVDVDLGTGKPPTQLRTKVALRNSNRPPTAALNCQGLANGHAVCDASGSTDPDGEALSFTWTMDGTPLPLEATFRLDQPSLPSGSSHVFTVTVKDSGGLTTTETRTVVMP
jgi:type II secretory pathway pseudopilin PulG